MRAPWLHSLVRKCLLCSQFHFKVLDDSMNEMADQLATIVIRLCFFGGAEIRQVLVVSLEFVILGTPVYSQNLVFIQDFFFFFFFQMNYATEYWR